MPSRSPRPAQAIITQISAVSVAELARLCADSVAESLAAGTPCLVTPVGGLTAAVEKLSDQLILKGTDSASIADGVIGALTGTLPLPDAAACLDFARRNYDWPVIASQVRAVYEAAQR